MKVLLANIPIKQADLFKLAAYFAHEPGMCLLYSGGSFDSAKTSFFTLFPYEKIWAKGFIQYHETCGAEEVLSRANPWDTLEKWIEVNTQIDNDSPSLPDWIGFFGYEMGAFSDKNKQLNLPISTTPDAYFQRSAILLEVNHQTNTGTLYLSEDGRKHLNDHQLHWIDQLSRRDFWMSLPYTLQAPAPNKKILTPEPSETFASYSQKIDQAIDWIRAGDIYQVNLSLKYQFTGHADPFDIFQRLALINPAPFSAYLRLPEFTIVSSSPERFLQKKGSRLETRPIKGTAPRGKNSEEDIQIKSELLNSSKDRAELLMITDLMRNDLGKISLPGSVKTPSICILETYANVHHLLSIIESQPQNNLHPVEIVRNCFPGGSITGCPKLSAMEAIATLEKRPRGVYTGSIGYFSHNGDFDFNIAIRTLLVRQNHLEVQLGGAIIIDSDPEKEFAEIQHKGASILKCLGIK